MDELEEMKERLNNMILVVQTLNMLVTTEIALLRSQSEKYKFSDNLVIRGMLSEWEHEIQFLSELKDQIKSI